MTARTDVMGIKNARGMRVLLAVLLACAMFAAMASGPSAASAAGDGGGNGRADAAQSTELTREVLHALRRDLGLTEEQARRQGALQAKAIKLDQELQATLGDAFAGSKYNASTGKLVVLVSDSDKLDDVEARGAHARQAKHSLAKLERVKAELDAATGKAKGTDRRHGGPRQARAAGLVSWYIDSETNTVHVTIDKGQAKQARAELAKYGDAVSIEETNVTPKAAAYMDGGDSINYNSCSAGFNLRNRSTGVGYLLTAGHCVSAGSTVRGQGGVFFGPVLERWFPTYDDAIVRNDNPSSFVQGPWVDTNPSNGSVISVYTHTDAPVGTTVCKSGITTRWTCGRITAKNETVTYDGTSTVYGLTRHNACVEKGDSGGANVSVTDAYRAEGVSSGAQMRWDGYRWRCLSAFGQANVSWYYPIADSLAHYGPRYGVSLW